MKDEYMKMPIIISLFGPPGCGKSTCAAYCFAKLKMLGVNCELVSEFAKDKVWEQNNEALSNQIYIFAKQYYRITRCANKVDVIVTDGFSGNILLKNTEAVGKKALAYFKKNNFKIAPETFSSMPGKEILISRPEEVTVVYYTSEFKYEENKLLGSAARLFDQHCQLLDGVTPAELGLVSDVETDGSLADLSEEEIAQVIDIYKQFIKAKANALQTEIQQDPELEKAYKRLKFTEKVITGEALVIEDENDRKRHKAANKLATKSMMQAARLEKAENTANLKQFLRRKGK